MSSVGSSEGNIQLRKRSMAVSGKSTSAALRGRALVVAIANYSDVGSLPIAVLNDGRDIAGILGSPEHCGYDQADIRVLLDNEATLAAMRSALADLAAASAPSDIVVIYFSGHGAQIGGASAPRSALVPVDCTLSDLSATTLLEEEFSAAIKDIKAKRLAVFLDACHSGGAAGFKSIPSIGLQSLSYSEKSLDRLAQGTGRVLIASSRSSETSLILPSATNSVFTGHLLEALRGDGYSTGDGLIRIFDVFSYVSEMVRRGVPGRQHPIFKATDLEDNFPIALDRGGFKRTVKAGASEGAPWELLEAVLSELYPLGPLDQDIWARAGGDPSRLELTGTGRARWFTALRRLRQGGGGTEITRRRLINTALDEFPHHPRLTVLLNQPD